MEFFNPPAQVISSDLPNDGTAIDYARWPSYNGNSVYFARSIYNTSFGLLLLTPYSIHQYRRVYWQNQPLCRDMALLKFLMTAYLNNTLHFCHLADGSTYAVTDSQFTSASTAGHYYIHLQKGAGTNVRLAITNHLGQGWDTATGMFSSSAVVQVDEVSSGYHSAGSGNLPHSSALTNDFWFPSFNRGAEVTVSATAPTLVRTYSLDSITSTAYPEVSILTVQTAAKPISLPFNTAWLVTDTNELCINLPIPAQTQFFGGYTENKVLDIYNNSGLISSTGLSMEVVRISTEDPTDSAYLTAITALASYTSLVVELRANKQVSFNPATITYPTLVVDILNSGNPSYYTLEGSQAQAVSLQAALYLPSGPGYPAFIKRLVIAPYLRRAPQQVSLANGTIDASNVYKAGVSQVGYVDSSAIYLSLSGLGAWASVFKTFNLTGTSSYRLKGMLNSPYDVPLLQAGTGPVLKIGMYSGCPVEHRHGLGYDSRVTNALHVPFWYVDVSTIAATIKLVSHIPEVNNAPYRGSVYTLANNSGQQLTWNGTTQLDLVVVKLSSTRGRLELYLNRYLACQVEVPWVDEGHFMYYAQQSQSYYGVANSFVLSSFTDDLGVTEPVGGTVIPAAQANVEYLALATARITSLAIAPDPFMVYFHDKTTSADLYLPVLAAPDPYLPVSFAVIRNFPFLSGAVYDKVIGSGEKTRSFIIDSNQASAFPTTLGLEEIGILYTHEPVGGGSYAVTLRTGVDWADNLGTFNAEPTTALLAYQEQPYLSLPQDLLTQVEDATRFNPSLIADISNGVQLVGSGLVGEGSAISLGFSAKSTEAWTLQFTRASLGIYLEGASFELVIIRARQPHILFKQESLPNLELLPYAKLPTLRLKFGRDNTNLPIVQLEEQHSFEFSQGMPLRQGRGSLKLDGSTLIRVSLEAHDERSLLSIHSGNELVATAILPMKYFNSGSLCFFHRNGGDSTETIGQISLRSGTADSRKTIERPLILAPTEHRSANLSVVALTKSLIYNSGSEVRNSYADIYIRNPNNQAVTLSLYQTGEVELPILQDRLLPSGATIVVRGRTLTSNMSLWVYSDLGVFVRVTAICELR